MRHVVLVTGLAAAMAFAGCSGSDEDRGTGGTGGTAGTGGGGPDTALSFDETTSIPATAASAAAIEAATRFANTISAIVDLASAGADAGVQGVAPKDLLPGFCANAPGGQADLVLPPGLPSGWSSGDQILLTLTDCEGSVLSSGAVSGSITIDIETVAAAAPDLRLDLAANVSLSGDTTMNGTFAAVAFVGIGGVAVQLGKQLDDDDLKITDGSTDLSLGCFDILVSLASNKSIVPLAVAKLGNKIYTINDYAQSPPAIFLDGNGVPSAGMLVMNGGDNRKDPENPMRAVPCPGFAVGENGSTITATFSEGGCIELSGAVQQSTNWAKLRVGDLTPGGGPECGGGITCEAVQGGIALADTDFSDWEVAFVSQTPGSTVEQQAERLASGGADGGAFRQMTHLINESTGCADESCSIVVYHRSNLTYDPSTEGAIAFIDYSESQRVIEPAFSGAAVGWAFYVEQDGTRYFARGAETSFNNTTWRTNSICGITPADFTPDGLDFSAGGDPITLGYTRSNTNTSTTNISTNVHGIDEFKVVIVKEPTQ